jgi:hypothetical protein
MPWCVPGVVVFMWRHQSASVGLAAAVAMGLPWLAAAVACTHVQAATPSTSIAEPVALKSPTYAVRARWEPTTPAVPVVFDRHAALQTLNRARAAWDRRLRIQGIHRAGPDSPIWQHLLPSYTYVRAQRVAENQVRFTAISVDQARVVRRALLVADPRELTFIYNLKHARYPKVVWDEHETEIGRHPDGAAPISVDALYDICEKDILGRHPELSARLSLTDKGELAHCGYLAEDCADCPQVSIQSVVENFVPKAAAGPLDYLCVAESGLFPPGSWDIKRRAACWDRRRDASCGAKGKACDTGVPLASWSIEVDPL